MTTGVDQWRIHDYEWDVYFKGWRVLRGYTIGHTQPCHSGGVGHSPKELTFIFFFTRVILTFKHVIAE
jgi:hypothetical protein